MNRYTIYCTKEQTKKALELGAPISRIPINGYDGSRPSYFTKSPDEEGYYECPAYFIPTVEQMVRWLMEQNIYPSFQKISPKSKTICNIFHNDRCEYEYFEDYDEAVLWGIDTALGYLSKIKEK